MAKLTPMMAQYREIKAQHEDCILMYRLGDFYEMFFEDAVEAAKILQITLTSRGKGGSGETPMCGVPYHAVEGYLAKLTRAGKKVAICDQVSEPGKGLVERAVTRVVTPGTTFNETILMGKSNNYVACVVKGGGRDIKQFALAYCDVTTGEFRVTELSDQKALFTELSKIRPAECIGEEELLAGLGEFLQENQICRFGFEYGGQAERELLQIFGVMGLESFGLEGRELAVEACGMIMDYLKETQKTALSHVSRPVHYQVSEYMAMDESLIRNLEIFYTNRDGKSEGSLIGVLDQTMTAMGGRMLRRWLMNPLLKAEAIKVRQIEVRKYLANSKLLRDVRDLLKSFYDVERLLSRLSLGSGNARDLIAMKESLKLLPELVNLGEKVETFRELTELIEKSIMSEPAMSVREGSMIADGFNKELDELRGLSREGKGFIEDLQMREAKRSGINSLKVKYNKVFGYYIEISNTNLANVPQDYIRKQTLVNAERFITPELKEYEDKVLNAEQRICELEYELFYQVRMEVIKEIAKIQKMAKEVAKIDVLSSFAFLAERERYCEPEIVEKGLEIQEGRHPVVEKLRQGFVPNDCKMGDGRKFLLITGPNMGGKSTYLRQVALIVLMSQIGSYVPAKIAKIAICDRIFTRVGATDNLSRGQSTFMVEMQEAAYILNQATEQSLVILDEIGRGTSTYDGVSIAWAMMEYLHDKIGAQTIFATHYHELLELADGLEEAVNLSVLVRESSGEGVVFLYRIVEGGVDKSYGIEVAKLAGLPVEVVSRARGVLRELENKHIQKRAISPDQGSLFERERGGLTEDQERLFEELKEVDLNKMTPLEAIGKLDEMQKKLRK